MTSTTIDQARGTPIGLRGPMSIGAVLSAAGSVGYIAMNFYDGSPRDAYSHPLGIVASFLGAAGALCLALALVRWRTSLPQWAVTGAAVGLIATSANAWYFCTGIVGLADHTSDALFMEILTSPWVFVMAAPKMILCLVTFAALAVSGWRDRSIPRLASIVLGVGAVLSLIPPHPPGLLMAALAFFVISRGEVAAKS
ncbi:MAG: hypothetical protein LKG20_04305 [Tetrasphaera jenkinsii]|jgi:uncharacterized membrane protein|nr:hypothetical protein [Tetrasphaera jenkinsii]